HCFSGDAAMAKRCAEAGYVMSFAGNVTFKNAGPLREAAAAAPVELLLVETDAPFLTPVPHRGKPNSPALAAYPMRPPTHIHQARARRHQADRRRGPVRAAHRDRRARVRPLVAAPCLRLGCSGRPRSARSRGGWGSGRPSGWARTSWSTRARSGGSWRWRSSAPVTSCWRAAPGSGRSPSAYSPRPAGGRVVAVEIDRVLAAELPRPVAARAPALAPRLAVVTADAARITPADLRRSARPTNLPDPPPVPGGEPSVLAANLPYNVAVPVVLHLLAALPSLARALVMVQPEVPDRMTPPPASRV